MVINVQCAPVSASNQNCSGALVVVLDGPSIMSWPVVRCTQNVMISDGGIGVTTGVNVRIWSLLTNSLLLPEDVAYSSYVCVCQLARLTMNAAKGSDAACRQTGCDARVSNITHCCSVGSALFGACCRRDGV